MILQIEHPLIYRIVLETSGANNFRIVESHQAGFRRLRFSFFADEPGRAGFELACGSLKRLLRIGPGPGVVLPGL